MKQEKENAVSPVVGVMLMLVVTIIIAALVSAFAGGLGTTTEAKPMITFSAEYGQHNGLLLRATSATESLEYGKDFQIYINKPSDANEFTMLNAANASVGYKIETDKTGKVTETGIFFTTGKVIYFSHDDLAESYKEITGSTANGDTWTAVGWSDDLIGRDFTVKLVDSDGTVYGQTTGKIIK